MLGLHSPKCRFVPNKESVGAAWANGLPNGPPRNSQGVTGSDPAASDVDQATEATV